ncbi:MFS transporter [Achromobacter denitrificans]|uniref:MFS transporter n=1 Tax=Achromobacter denitrificans TaxID=32002 RepID=UPI0023E87D86|nr:MFS transporter [Achromobacter denitrificans]MDF3942544.1 MFS transporter [Achromobacter denitrificans]
MPLHLIALAAAAFGIGTSEFVIMGLLPNVAEDLRVGIDIAGLLITGYAMGVVIGAPIMAIVTAKLPRKAALIGLASTFVLGNLLCALAPSYGLLMAARVFTAFCHGAFFGLGAVVAADLVPRNQRASAIALMFTGLTLANVLGVPLGTALGQVAGWRSTFWVVSGIGLVAVAALAAWLPSRIPMQPGNILREFKVLRDARVAWPLAASVLASAALFCVLTYIAPLLREVTGVSERGVTGVLLLFGVALTIGSTLGGKLGDRNLEASLRRIFIGLLLVFPVLSQAIHSLVPMLLTTFVWGVLGFAVVPLLQTLIVDQAAEAPNLASTLNQGAFNLGNASGAWLGSLALGQGLPLTDLPWMSAGITLAVLLLTLWGTRYYGRHAGTTLAGQAGALTPSRSDA